MIFTFDEQTKSVKVKLEPEELELAKSSPKSFKILMDFKKKIKYKDIENTVNLMKLLKEHNK